MTVPDSTQKLVVLRQGSHGLEASSLTDEFQERLPQHEVHLARTPAEEEAQISDATIVSSVDISRHLLEKAPNLRWFQG